jgi:MSHA biogenesis protein MshL
MNAAISSGNTSSGTTGNSTNINISSGGQSGSSSSSSASSTAQGNVNVTTSGTADLWREIRKGLEVLIFGDIKDTGETEGGFSRGDEKTGKKLVLSEIAGIVLITDNSDNMEKIEDFLKDVEQAAKKQVMIQAHIVEVALNDNYKFGINWDALLQFPSNWDITLSQNLVPPLPTGAEPAFRINVSHNKVDAVIEAMKEQGQVEVLSSPKVSTMNNQKAVIKLTTKEVSWVTNSFLNSTGDVLLTYTTPQIDEIGLFLDVIPQVDDNGVITMQIHPSISEKTRESSSPDQKSTKPVIDTREVDTMIKTRNGQTIVIAGLITNKLTDTTKSVPLLGDIPVIGAAFKQVIQEKRKSELVILMTPFVLTDRSIEDIRKEHEERLRKAGRTFEAVPFIGKSEK